MKLSIIVAIARNGVIGRANTLPWHLPADLKHFKAVTMGKPVIMGRKTWESIGRALPGRKNIVITRSPGFLAQGCEVASSLDAALKSCEGSEEAFIIGGAQLYADALPRAHRLLITRVDADVEGDTRFPAYDTSAWRLVSTESHPCDEKNAIPFAFETYARAPGRIPSA